MFGLLTRVFAHDHCQFNPHTNNPHTNTQTDKEKAEQARLAHEEEERVERELDDRAQRETRTEEEEVGLCG